MAHVCAHSQKTMLTSYFVRPGSVQDKNCPEQLQTAIRRTFSISVSGSTATVPSYPKRTLFKLGPHWKEDVKIELLTSRTGSGETLLGLILLKNNELHSLIRQEIGSSSSVCTHHLKSKEEQFAIEHEGVANLYMISIVFSVVPNQITRRRKIFDDSVFHAS
jgi:hypothetical protein